MSLSVVVVDDTLEFRAIVRFIMATASETMTLVGEAADGEEALALILGEGPAVVITDILMLRMNGIQLLRRIKKERPQTKVIVRISSTEESYGRLALGIHVHYRHLGRWSTGRA